LEYSLQALPNGKCVVREDVVFSGGSTEVVHPFYLYIWLIRGGGHTIVVDTGPKDLAAFNRGTAEYIPGGVTQEPDEETVAALAKAGVLPEDVDHVILTHLHGDHAHNFYLFENAKLVASRRGIVDGFPRSLPKVLLEPLIPGWPDSLVLTDDEEVLPGIRRAARALQWTRHAGASSWRVTRLTYSQTSRRTGRSVGRTRMIAWPHSKSCAPPATWCSRATTR